jgi:hypothetical protein
MAVGFFADACKTVQTAESFNQHIIESLLPAEYIQKLDSESIEQIFKNPAVQKALNILRAGCILYP